MPGETSRQRVGRLLATASILRMSSVSHSPGHRVGPHEVRGSPEAERPGGLADALVRQVISLARRQVCGAVARPPHDAFGQQVGPGCGGRSRAARRE